MNSDLIAKHAEVMKKANEYLKTNDISVVEHNKKLMNIYLTMLSLVCSGKLNGIDLLRFNYFYCKVDKSEKKKELNVDNLFKSTLTVDETASKIINLIERTPRDFFEDEAPYRIIVEASLSLNSFVEILRYEFSDDIEDFVISKNERAIFEIEKEYRPIYSHSLKDILGDTKVKKSEKEEKLEELETLKDNLLTDFREEIGANNDGYRLNERYYEMLLGFYKILPTDKLNDIKTVMFKYYYVEPKRAKRTVHFLIENPFRSELPANYSFKLFRQFVASLHKSIFTDIDPYLITLEACEEDKGSLVEMIKYVYDEHLERFITYANQQTLAEIAVGDKDICHMQRTLKTLEEIKETVKTASSEISCGCNREHGNLLPINEKELSDFKLRALDDIYSNYRAILDYGNPFEYERKLIENRIAFLNDFKHMIENVTISSNDSISVEVTSIYENEDTTTYKTDAPIFNIFSDDIKVGYDVYGVLLGKFINEVVPNPLVQPVKMFVYICEKEEPNFLNGYSKNSINEKEALYFVKRDNEWVHHESLKYGPMKGDK
jgi:hypothetical protein